MNYAMDVAWAQDSRGFWTRRKRTATSLITVLALVAGTAVAFKVFDLGVPDNVARDASSFDFEVHKKDSAVPDPDFVNTAGGTPVFQANDQGGNPIETFPGITREVEVKLINTNLDPSVDATFYVYVDQDTYEVTGCYDAVGDPIGVDETGLCEAGAVTAGPVVIPPGGITDRTRKRFIAFWDLAIDREKIVQTPAGDVNEDDHLGQNLLNPAGDPDDSGRDLPNRLNYHRTCRQKLVVMVKGNPCDLGLIRGAGSTDLLGEASDTRYYWFGLTEEDDGADQSPFKGWILNFDLVFQARVPAVPEDGAPPVRER